MYPKRILHVRLLPVLVAFIFSLLAFVFSLLAINSKEWAVRKNYDPLYTPKNWTEANVIYTLYRSPFVICSASANVTNVNSTSSSDDGDSETITTYTVSCQNFRPFGFSRTSCEEEVATQNDTAVNLGDTRLCQQIHYAGNFGIASTVFISLGFILTSIAAIATFTILFRSSMAVEQRDAELPKHDRKRPEQSDEIREGDRHEISTPAQNTHETHHRHKRSSLIAHINLVLLTFLFIGVVTAVISQFYAVEGLIQSAYNNADFSTSQGASAAEVQISGIHGPWYQGKGLSVYATCAWGFAAAAGAVAAKAWTLPEWNTVF
ncbi:hypothetical protein EG329_013473 [Mollisiaceae sp. DMI_Dod_QoI]|nr:hypothetical protein EG329_013473 [Helotiales sp. DMI_Dod_QoI]